MDWPMLRELIAELDEAKADRAVRCLVLTGTGKGFCTGADMQEGAEMVAALEKNKKAARADLDAWHHDLLEVIRRVFEFSRPTVAMVNGAAVGGGMDLALACDFRYAVEGAKFRGFAHLGLGPEGGSSWTLPRLVGLDRAKRFCFLGEIWRAEQALEYGMLTEVVPVDRLRAETMTFAKELAARPTQVIGLMKAVLDTTYSRSFVEALSVEQKTSLQIQETEDHHEMMRAAGIG
jgi:2-(1,2-epoxy-1,2-dihydrophenyl)acetyl-CoA isomerase